MIRVPVLVLLVIISTNLLVYLWLMHVLAWRARTRRVPDLHAPSAQPTENALRRVVVPYRRYERESDCEVCRQRISEKNGGAAGACGPKS